MLRPHLHMMTGPPNVKMMATKNTTTKYETEGIMKLLQSQAATNDIHKNNICDTNNQGQDETKTLATDQNKQKTPEDQYSDSPGKHTTTI